MTEQDPNHAESAGAAAEASDQPDGTGEPDTTVTDLIGQYHQTTARLEAVIARHLELSRERAEIVRALHDAGLSWSQVAGVLGVSKARAHAIGRDSHH